MWPKLRNATAASLARAGTGAAALATATSRSTAAARSAANLSAAIDWLGGLGTPGMSADP